MPNYRSFLRAFERELERTDPQPERMALYIAGMVNPDLDVSYTLDLLDTMAIDVSHQLAEHLPGRSRAERFLAIFNDDLRFHGDQTTYYSARNSFLDDVIERRRGLPITLSLLCMAIGRRLSTNGLDIQIEGIGLPSHFMALYKDEAGSWLLDPFYGRVLSTSEASTYLTQLLNQPIALTAEMLKPVTTELLAYRMLNNLRIAFLNEDEFHSTTRVLDYMLVIAPENPQLWKERGLLNYQSDLLVEAARDLRRYFFLKGALLVVFDMIDDEAEEYEDEIEELSEEDRPVALSARRDRRSAHEAELTPVDKHSL